MRRNPPSADRILHNVVRFAAFPSELVELQGGTRGERMRDFLRRLLADNADAFAHGAEAANGTLASFLRGDFEGFAAVVGRDERQARRTNLYGHTPLHLAVMLGATTVVEALLAAGAPVAERDRWGNAPLHWAAFVGDRELIARLREVGAEAGVTNAFGATAADYAALLGDTEGEPVESGEIAVVESEGAMAAGWSVARVTDEVGFVPWRRSIADNDLLFDLFLRSRGGLSRKESIRLLPDPGPPAPVALRYFGGAMGWGLVTTAPVVRGAYLGSYCGRIQHIERGSEPDLAYASNLGGYASHVQVAVVGREVGSVMTRANSSTGPKDATMKIRTGWRQGEPVIEMTARRDLGEGTQLLWDYGTSYWRARGIEPQASPAD